MRLRIGALALGAAFVLGAALRFSVTVGSDFPLHDGGLFLVMSQEIRAADFALPLTTAYNDTGAPFAYPPLGIYILAGLSSVASTIDLLRFLPLLYSLLAIAGSYLVIRTVTTSTHAGLGSLIFALTPSAFDWLIVGGGVTRGLGFTLALLSIFWGVRALRDPGAPQLMGVGALFGLTALAHLEAAAFAVASTAVLGVGLAGLRRSIIGLAVAGAAAAVLTAPWWMTVISRHGIDVFVGAAGSRQAWVTALQRLMELRLTGGSFLLFDVPLLLALVGLAVCVLRRQWLLPIWALAILLTPAAGSYYLTPVIAALGAVGAIAIGGHIARRQRPLTASLALSFALLNVLLVPNGIGQQLSAIPASDRTVMADMSSSDEAVAVLTRRPWWGEGPGEWFPALTGYSNARLAQGAEWLGADAWHHERQRHEALQGCFSVSCVADWMRAERTNTLFLSAVSGVPVEEFLRDGRFLLITRMEDSAVLRLQSG